ncbi:hypothetical protein B0T25DRAFT_336173 [Lasiosphaeria hispida]|uniref:F-box domain-containing protein n=1 Tax=Lasiosphaeria hispida TaxID=260671 RepID=A0AAJ0H6F0_9PEZI|nr:hypothetical protein B0T25DRAFT_336173 [Lasiosphaeria hispida]
MASGEALGQRQLVVGLASLPSEILLHIISFLEPAETANLQLVSRGFRNLARDDNLWRSRCFQESSYRETLDLRRDFWLIDDPFLDKNGDHEPEAATTTPTPFSRERERVRIMANWDPSFPGERVSWYEEYIQRQGPVAINWLQLPHHGSRLGIDYVEARGIALYRPDNPHEEENGAAGVETLLAVSPLDDGSVCLWDVNGTLGDKKRGAIVARSRPGILFIDGPAADNTRRSKRVDSGVTECVSVDSQQHRAFFAVQSHLIEVDLQRLSVVGCESYPWSITALSAASPTVPLTVGTSLEIHLHDYRARNPYRNGLDEKIEDFDRMGPNELYGRTLRRIFDNEPLAPYAPLAQPGPLSILHLQRPGQEAELSDDIYVAGRFSNILHYDRRKFPSIMGSIHSGASLCSMTSLPYPFSTMDSELRRVAQLSLEQVETSKNVAGVRTLIACGEYNTKGSLEMYGLSPAESADPGSAGGLQTSSFKNRHTSSDSKLLSIVNHGMRIACSDGSGNIKWFERDGFTEVRRCKIGHSERAEGPSVFASMPGSDDIARKLLPTRARGQASSGGTSSHARVNDSDLLFWTGEKLGLATVSAQPGFTAEDFEEQRDDLLHEEALARADKEREYSERMRWALERQADDVRFVRNLGLGSGRRRS